MTSAQQKATRRKKRTCKHVLKAKEERELQQKDASNKQETPNKPRRKKSQHAKDPNEAAAYLSAWKHRDAGGAWKFNKNTQSWLLRHQYQPEKVSKGTFGILLEYMEGLQGNTHARMIADATRRVLRYKEYSKSNPEEKETEESNDKTEKEPKDALEDEDDETRWKRMDDHEKRKDYKRARRVLDALKE